MRRWKQVFSTLNHEKQWCTEGDIKGLFTKTYGHCLASSKPKNSECLSENESFGICFPTDLANSSPI